MANYQALAARYKNVALIIHPATYTQRRREGYRELLALKGIKQVAILPDAKQHALYDLPGGWVYVEVHKELRLGLNIRQQMLCVMVVSICRKSLLLKRGVCWVAMLGLGNIFAITRSFNHNGLRHADATDFNQ